MTASPGLPVIVNPGVTSQVPLTGSGGTIINVGSVPVNLSPTDPADTPYVLAPNGSVPWPGIGGLYATVSGSIPGSLYYINGISALNAGNTEIGAVGLSSITGVLGFGFTLAAGDSNIAFALPGDNPPAFRVWAWTWSTTSTDPTKGHISIDFVTSNEAFQGIGVIDRCGITQQGSNRFAGLYVPAPNPPFQTQWAVTNTMDVGVEIDLSYSPSL